MSILEKELTKHVESLHLKEKGLAALSEIRNGVIEDGGSIDGYAIADLLFDYSIQVIRLLQNSLATSIITRFDIFIKEIDCNTRIGYYDYVVDFDGNFLDEFFVIEK